MPLTPPTSNKALLRLERVHAKVGGGFCSKILA